MEKIKGFTLAEIMIVLTVIGVLSAILLPVAMNSTPDENVMKFKKGNNTLGTVIHELVNSDKYYSDGDLGIKADGTLVDGTQADDTTYFCKTFADVLNTKSINCLKQTSMSMQNYSYVPISNSVDLEHSDTYMDKGCKEDSNIQPEIITADGITYYNVSPVYTFGIKTGQQSSVIEDMRDDEIEKCRNNPNRHFLHKDENGMLKYYKIFCMDIDGIDKGEDPFGYGIRTDGKILYGKRAKEWMEKSIQKED